MSTCSRKDNPGLARDSDAVLSANSTLPRNSLAPRSRPALASRPRLTARSRSILATRAAAADRLAIDGDNLPVLDDDGVPADGNDLVVIITSASASGVPAILADGVLTIGVAANRDTAVLTDSVLTVLVILAVGILTVRTIRTVLAMSAALDEIVGTVTRKTASDSGSGTRVLHTTWLVWLDKSNMRYANRTRVDNVEPDDECIRARFRPR
ncbi:hypothetical protein L227DRAFT_576080 [Lentinus tigrinus ALCF2SS1-6]|uniref:Uncharacterized protein n=1 Tax=Lentinus tigrinus ALCF2SS1-6 TaxID=1328759 RepID=A0A5C2S7F3_9APHY|nr:hypothetical protein L227DRAFT_576080 [Lentinus tigrinus ALCF2SS1-6]